MLMLKVTIVSNMIVMVQSPMNGSVLNFATNAVPRILMQTTMELVVPLTTVKTILRIKLLNIARHVMEVIFIPAVPENFALFMTVFVFQK